MPVGIHDCSHSCLPLSAPGGGEIGGSFTPHVRPTFFSSPRLCDTFPILAIGCVIERRHPQHE